MKLDQINQLFRTLDREMWIVTAASRGQIGGLVATFVSPISIVPELPRMAVAIARQHQTWHLIEAAGSFAVHLLRQDQFELAWRFGTQSGRDVDKFQQLKWTPGVTGSPLLNDVPGWLECRVESRMETGDRTLYLAEVVAGEFPRDDAPLTQRQFLQQASPEQLAILRSQMLADGARDADAIKQWRQSVHQSVQTGS